MRTDFDFGEYLDEVNRLNDGIRWISLELRSMATDDVLKGEELHNYNSLDTVREIAENILAARIRTLPTVINRMIQSGYKPSARLTAPVRISAAEAGKGG